MNVHLKTYGQGKPLVFFHGWGFSHSVWLPLVPELSAEYQIILVDLPGFGGTPLMEWADFKKQLLSQLPPQFTMVGWSMGGLYATRLALESDHVTHLINIASSPYFLMHQDWPGVSKKVFTTFYKNLAKDPHATLTEFIQLQAGKSSFQNIIDTLPSTESLAFGLSILDTWDFREPLRHFVQPAAYMFGRLDPIVPVKTMKAMERIYPDFKYVFFSRAAHMPFISHRDMFVNELRGLLS
jgi:pimeloyl-[acyl-carrier protein] methyl ester esterase